MMRPKRLVILKPNELGRVMAPDEMTTSRGTLRRTHSAATFCTPL